MYLFVLTYPFALPVVSTHFMHNNESCKSMQFVLSVANKFGYSQMALYELIINNIFLNVQSQWLYPVIVIVYAVGSVLIANANFIRFLFYFWTIIFHILSSKCCHYYHIRGTRWIMSCQQQLTEIITSLMHIPFQPIKQMKYCPVFVCPTSRISKRIKLTL